MTQPQFSRPGAVDLSSLKRPAAPPPGAGGASAPSGGAPGAPESGGAVSAYALDVDTENFQQVLETSMTAPVLLVVHSPSRSPESRTYADDVAAIVDQYEGRFLAALIDVDANPQIAQALQVTQIPLLLVLLDGRPATQPIPGVLSADELSTLLNQLAQSLTTQGVTGRHQPLSPAAAPAEDSDEGERVDPRYAAAQDALARDDVDGAVAEYRKLVDANPADHEAVAGLAMATVLQRTHGVDPQQALAAADAAPDDVEAQTLVADLDLVGGQVDDAFARLVELVRRTSEKERDRAREHLVGLFAAVGNDDARVLAARRNLASALF